MKLMHRKSRWERLIEPVTGHPSPSGAVKSGLVTAGTMACLTVASALVSAIRHSKESR